MASFQYQPYDIRRRHLLEIKPQKPIFVTEDRPEEDAVYRACVTEGIKIYQCLAQEASYKAVLKRFALLYDQLSFQSAYFNANERAAAEFVERWVEQNVLNNMRAVIIDETIQHDGDGYGKHVGGSLDSININAKAGRSILQLENPH
jgi:hypothetical protein